MAEHPEIIGNHFKIEKLIGYGGCIRILGQESGSLVPESIE